MVLGSRFGFGRVVGAQLLVGSFRYGEYPSYRDLVEIVPGGVRLSRRSVRQVQWILQRNIGFGE